MHLPSRYLTLLIIFIMPFPVIGYCEEEQKLQSAPDTNNEKVAAFAEKWEEVQDTIGQIKIEMHAAGYGQFWGNTEVNGERYEGQQAGGTDIRTRFYWHPFDDFRFFLQTQYAQSDTDLLPQGKGLVLTNMNELTSDSTKGGRFRIYGAEATKHFVERNIFITLGVTDPESFMDENRFANNQGEQFMAQMFVDEPIFDIVDEQGVIAALGGNPFDDINVVGMVSSTTKPFTPGDRKDMFDNVWWDAPFWGGQIKWSPKFGDLKGNYRFFGWTTAYDQPHVADDGSSQNWSVAFNFDQDITDKIGLFGRYAYGNPDVNEMVFSWSLGTSMTGIIPEREKDTLGIAFGGVLANQNTPNHGMEFHNEIYYRANFLDLFALTPDFQVTVNPLGDTSARPIWQAMVRLEFFFETP